MNEDELDRKDKASLRVTPRTKTQLRKKNGWLTLKKYSLRKSLSFKKVQWTNKLHQHQTQEYSSCVPGLAWVGLRRPGHLAGRCHLVVVMAIIVAITTAGRRPIETHKCTKRTKVLSLKQVQNDSQPFHVSDSNTFQYSILRRQSDSFSLISTLHRLQEKLYSVPILPYFLFH